MSLDSGTVQVDLSEFLTVKRNTLQSWVLVDKTGQKEMLDVDKHTIMHRFQVSLRDIRLIDPNFIYPHAIVVRERVFILNLEHIKGIVSAEEVLFRGPLAPSVIPIVQELQRRLGLGAENDESPFEFRVLKLALENVCSSLQGRTLQLETTIYPELHKLVASKISTDSLDIIRQMKTILTELIARNQKLRTGLELLLDDEEDMADLYLSRKLAGVSSSVGVSGIPKRHASFAKKVLKISRSKRAGKNDLEELEMLLETYFMQTDGNFRQLTALREYIHDTEDYINIQLDNIRNQLIKFELILSCGGICISVYSLVAGILGMNIPFSWNTKAYMFKWVVSGTGTLCALLFVLILSWARYKNLLGN